MHVKLFLLSFLSIPLFGCQFGDLPTTTLKTDFSGIVGEHAIEDVSFDAGYGLYEGERNDFKPCSVSIGFLPFNSKRFVPLYTVVDASQEQCGWNYSGGCSRKVVFQKNITLSIDRTLLDSESTNFSLGLFLYGIDQTEEDKCNVNKCSEALIWDFVYFVEGDVVTISEKIRRL